MNKYNTLFFFLLKLKRVNYCLTLIWKELGGVEFRVSKHSRYRFFLTCMFVATENFNVRVQGAPQASVPLAADAVLFEDDR